MDTESLAAIVVARVREVDYVSLVEMLQMLKPHMEVSGDTTICLATDSNVILWAGVSDGFAQVFDYMSDRGLVRLQGASLLTYLVDGGVSNLPLAKRLPKDGYKKPHWLPVVLRPGDATVSETGHVGRLL